MGCGTHEPLTRHESEIELRMVQVSREYVHSDNLFMDNTHNCSIVKKT